MIGLTYRFVCYALMLSISVSVIPWQLLHHHQEEISCEPEVLSLADDSCHNSIYHPKSFQETPCDHNSHLDKEHDLCELCWMLKTRHNNLFVTNYSWFNPLDLLGNPIQFGPLFTTFPVSERISNKDPPAS